MEGGAIVEKEKKSFTQSDQINQDLVVIQEENTMK
jgi:hypothetical protein